MRRGHGSSIHRPVAITTHRTKNTHTRSTQIHGCHTIVTEACQVVVLISCRNRDDIRQVKRRRISRYCIVVTRRISSGSHKQMPFALCCRYCIILSLHIGRSAITVVRDLRAHGYGILNATHNGRRIAEAISTEGLKRHNLDFPVDPGHTNRIVTHTANRTGAMRTVIMIVNRVAIVIVEVITVNVINVSVTVIIYAVSGRLTVVAPHVICQIFMRVFHARINHSHHNASRTDLIIPCQWCMNLLHAPKLAVSWIIRSVGIHHTDIIWFCIYDDIFRQEVRQFRFHCRAINNLNLMQRPQVEILLANRTK